MLDLTQAHKRRIVFIADQHWLVCYDVAVLPGDEPGIAGLLSARFLALAVHCNSHGDIELPAPTYLIQFQQADLRNPEPRTI